MSGKPFAHENVMEDYMSALLTEEPVVDELQKSAISQLLEKSTTIVTEPPVEQHKAVEPVKELQTVVDNKPKSVRPKPKTAITQRPDSDFQALFFEVAGLTLAVPLTELGGIHQMDTVNPLFGKPGWYKGVMLHKAEKLSVVDTAKWIMPQKSAEKLAESTKYQYLIMLDQSPWGLACERLVNTATLKPEDVKWRDTGHSRPWLAGMVKNKMCALVNVQQLIDMLDQGLSSND